MGADPSPNHIYLHDASIHTLSTTITSITPFAELPDADKPLFKSPPDDSIIATTSETIFFPQGGGQPSDVGSITLNSAESPTLNVTLVRTSISQPSRILHLGSLSPPDSKPTANVPATITLDSNLRSLHSRWHTAGHLLSLAIRQIAPEVKELKASHYPSAAFVEFRGLIDGKLKDPIQERVNELLGKALPVKIHWWDEATLREKCSGGLEGIEAMLTEIKSGGDNAYTKLRAVEIEGLGSYPCGGTHLPLTTDIGKIEVRKIKRQSGISKVSYSVS